MQDSPSHPVHLKGVIVNKLEDTLVNVGTQSQSKTWMFVKLAFIAITCANSYYMKSAPFGNLFPFFYPIIFVLVLFVFGFFFSKVISKNGYVPGGIRASLWINPLKYPLPFFQFAAFVSLFSGLVLTLKYWGYAEHMPNGLIRISVSTAILSAIQLVTRKWHKVPLARSL